MTNNTRYEEDELVERLKMRDRPAFEYLYDHYSAALFGLISKMITDNHLAEDILQEAFVKIWNNFSTYDASKGRLFTWMVNLTRNLAIDTLRSKAFKKQAKIQKSDIAVGNVSDSADEIGKHDAMGIRTQLQMLKEDQKEIIDMAYFNGFTQDEISKKLGIPLGTVKTRMRTAISNLKKLLQP